jgi:transcription-repair coupling factor (superfamily II helicase)
VYRDNDVLFVSIHSLHKISKFKGGDRNSPKIYKLGSGSWQKLKQTTKSKVKDIANELIKLYAERIQEKDTILQPIPICSRNWKPHLFTKTPPISLNQPMM